MQLHFLVFNSNTDVCLFYVYLISKLKKKIDCFKCGYNEKISKITAKLKCTEFVTKINIIVYKTVTMTTNSINY